MSFEEVHHLKGGAAGDFPMSGGGGFFWKPRGGAVKGTTKPNWVFFVLACRNPAFFFKKKKKWED